MERLRQSLICLKYMDLSISIIDDDHQVGSIIRSTNLVQYELIDLPKKQPGDTSHEHRDVGIAATLVTGSTSRLAPREERGVHEMLEWGEEK